MVWRRRLREPRRPGPVPLETVMSIHSVRSWDEQVVVPRFGFASASDYYQRMTVGPLLPDMEIPALFVASPSDPMIPAGSLRPVLAQAARSVEVRWQARGGHVGFPGEPQLMRDILDWLAQL